MDITIIKKCFWKYVDDDVHMKENVRLDILKNQDKKKC